MWTWKKGLVDKYVNTLQCEKLLVGCWCLRLHTHMFHRCHSASEVVPKCVYSFLIVPVLPDVVSVADESELSSRCIVMLPDRLIGKRDIEPKTPD